MGNERIEETRCDAGWTRKGDVVHGNWQMANGARERPGVDKGTTITTT